MYKFYNDGKFEILIFILGVFVERCKMSFGIESIFSIYKLYRLLENLLRISGLGKILIIIKK